MPYTLEENKERQEALYRFLLSRGDNWSTTDMATSFVKQYPAYFGENYHNSAARRLLTADIEAINSSDEFNKIIISGSRGIKLATEDEFSHFIGSELKEIFGKLRRIRKLSKKASRDQQIDIEGQIADVFLEEE